MATEEQQMLEALKALASIPDEFHWFCDLTEFDEGAEPQECALDTKQRIDRTQTLLKLFAIDSHPTLPWLKNQLTKQLSRCAECVKTFHEKKREMFVDMQREYDLTEIENFFELLTDWDVGRILPQLLKSDQLLRNLPPNKQRLNNLDKGALYAMYDVLCDPTLLYHEPLASYFKFTFTAVQQKNKLKVNHELPAMIVFLFDKDQGLRDWAICTCERRLPAMEPTNFEKELLSFLTKQIRRATEYTTEDELSRFFVGALHIIRNASSELILKCICGASEDLIKFTINHVADKAKYLESILLLIGELMRKLRYDFWDAASPVSPTTFVDWVFANPQIEGTVSQDNVQGENFSKTMQHYMNWIVPFSETLRPSNRPQASSNLLFNLLNKFQNPRNQPLATALCLKMGIVVLRMSLDDLTKEGISGSVDHILCRTALKLVAQHISPLRRVLTGTNTTPKEVSENLLEASREAKIVLQCALILDCRVVSQDYRLLSKDRPVPSGTNTTYFRDLYDTVLDQFVLNDTEFACEILGSLQDLVGLEKIRIQEEKSPAPETKVNESPLRTAKLEFNKTLGLLNATVGEILNRVSEYDPGNLIQILRHSKAGRFVIASLFSPEHGYYLPSVDIIKQAFNTIGKVDGLTLMLANHFDTAIEAFMWGIEQVTMMRTFGPMPSLVKTCVYLVQILCDSPDGLLLQEGKFSTEAEKSMLTRFWTCQWELLGAIFEETIQFGKTQDRGALVEFTRDTMEYADLLFSSFPAFEHAIAPLVPESAFEANSQRISKTGIMLLQCGNKSIHKIAMWLRLRDEPLLRLCHGLLCKILKQLEQANIPVEPEGISRLMKFASGGGQNKYQTNMTEQQKADLRAACGGKVTVEKPFVRKSDMKKQVTLAQWAAPIDVTKGAKEIDVIEIQDDDDIADEEIEKSEKPVVHDKQKPLQKPMAVVAPQKAKPVTPRPSAMDQFKFKHKDLALERARADVAERIRLRKEKEAAMQSTTVGSALQGMNIKPKQLTKTVPTIITGEETSSSEEEADEDDDGTGLFALATKAKKTTVLLEGPHPGFRQPVNFTVQKQMRSAADLRARLTPDLSPLYRRILNWDFFHNSDFPPGSSAKDYTMVSNTFRNVSEYKSTFEPLLMLECWNQFRKAKEENNFTVFTIELATRMNADNFVELHMTMDQAEFASQKVSVVESDVLLLSAATNPLSAPTEPNCLARVVGITKKRTVVEISSRCLPSSVMLPALKVKAKYRAAKILSLTPLEREYGALLSLMYYDLLDEILNARPSPLVPPSEEQVKHMRSIYQVNEPQARAICAATDNEGFTLIQGPPGSGKTKTVVGIVGAILTPLGGTNTGGSTPAVSTKITKKLLVCAPSNAAVDELVLRFKEGVRTTKGEHINLNIVRLGRSEAINAAVKDVTLEELVDSRLSGHEANKKGLGVPDVDAGQLREEMNKLLAERDAIRVAKDNAFANKDENGLKLHQEERALTEKIRVKGRQIDAKQDALNTDRRNQDILRRKIQQEIMDQAHILCATLSGAGHEMLKGMNVEFDTVIIDEAAQSIELSALIPLKYGCTKCILVGDPKQLPPTVLSRDAAKYMYEQSLFVRMQMNHPQDIHLLSIQYRMHPEISRFPSQQFYDSELQDGPNMEKHRQRIWHHSSIFGPYRFFDIQGQESNTSGHSLVNYQEVNIAISLYRRLITDFREQNFAGLIGIITPYKQQLRELKRRFESEFGSNILESIDFNTTDAFQGREREIIIFSCVRASPSGGVGFLSDIRRMNVGLTRAKSSLFILGNAQSLLRNEFWGKLVRDARARGVYIDGPIQALLSRPTRISDPSKQSTILPMAMDIDSVPSDATIKREAAATQRNIEYIPTKDPRINQETVAQDQRIKQETAVKDPRTNQEAKTQDPRKRPSPVDSKPGSRKQQATGQGNTPTPTVSRGSANPIGTNKQPVIPLGKPAPAPIVPPASLLPPTYDFPDEDNTDQLKAPLCYRCGNHGHMKVVCPNPPNPSKVEHMKRYGRGDPHDRSIPPIQSSLLDDKRLHNKRRPSDDASNPSKRREMEGLVPSTRNYPPTTGYRDGIQPSSTNAYSRASNSLGEIGQPNPNLPKGPSAPVPAPLPVSPSPYFCFHILKFSTEGSFE
ncbi:SEN1 N terminal-domain-containing protein [Kalaharituber pfeilii]|nr:SEN1 N terminal-domain-containing protein [Kalaharituber pfeilii]